MCVMNKQFELLEFVSEPVYVDSQYDEMSLSPVCLCGVSSPWSICEVVVVSYVVRAVVAVTVMHFSVNLFMSKVYNECVSRLFLWICIIYYAQLYKSSHALFYDLAMTVVTRILYTCYLSINFANRNDMLPVWYK